MILVTTKKVFKSVTPFFHKTLLGVLFRVKLRYQQQVQGDMRGIK